MAKPGPPLDRARENFDRNMNRSQQDGASAGPKWRDILQNRLSWLIGSVVALVAGVGFHRQSG
ncbi:hypothetical protein [Bradyrhizobium jicamae]|uniref:hypothetical protein n=1 Tax=Bradyrhizobium jicamae TaxID=280332 RepID=UPI001BA6CE9B|nr:hypothetical protein [Bradyrhizobium jicamae]MBR0936886.1 hypothetical protein [Bradyrhizobium jicamae]